MIGWWNERCRLIYMYTRSNDSVIHKYFSFVGYFNLFLTTYIVIISIESEINDMRNKIIIVFVIA